MLCVGWGGFGVGESNLFMGGQRPIVMSLSYFLVNVKGST